MSPAWDLTVSRQDLARTHVEAAEVSEPAQGEAVLAVDRFGITANNVTYAVFGEAMSYWNFFPAPEGWGRVPVWGFADVVASRVDGLEEGQRLYGYLPMSSHLLIRPDRVDAHGVIDGVEHRRNLPPVYNRYSRVPSDVSPSTENLQLLLRPLFTTSWLIDDHLGESDCFGAPRLIITSASSKTGLGLAHEARANGRAEVVGLTSAANVAFCEASGCYDQVVAYDEIEQLERERSVSVDMAGNPEVLGRLHRHLGDELAASILVGRTHWEGPAEGGEMPGPTPVLFFAPDHVRRRSAEWGPAGFDQRLAAAWDRFAPAAAGWIEVDEVAGPEAAAAAWVEVLDGRTPPDRAVVVTAR